MKAVRYEGRTYEGGPLDPLDEAREPHMRVVPYEGGPI